MVLGGRTRASPKMGQTRPMADDPRPELSSVSTQLEELARRVTGIADRHAASDRTEGIAAELYEVERSLRTAQRRLDKLMVSLR